MAWKWFIALFAVAAILGCGGPTSEKVTPTVTPPIESIKGMLKDIAEAGAPFSGWDQIDGHIAELKQSDPDKAAKLEAGVAEINKLKDPAAIKAKAESLLKDLE